MSLKDTWYDLAFRGVVFVRCPCTVSSVFSPSIFFLSSVLFFLNRKGEDRAEEIEQ